MATEPSIRARAWPLFDHIVATAAPQGNHSNPWEIGPSGKLRYAPDFRTLTLLLGVPLYLKAATQSGVPALALDVWLSYELRRAGFDPNAIWPRPVPPRVLPTTVVKLLEDLPVRDRAQLEARINARASISGVTSSSANILGKNYIKQVDVVMSDWSTGPEVLISTKRMDSSYGKNAPNRIEESYGDAKNLRLRHPLAALGFVFGLRSEILTKEPLTAEWLADLLAKLGREDDAYHATCLVMMEYSDSVAVADGGEDVPATVIPEPGVEAGQDGEASGEQAAAESELGRIVASLPSVKILDVSDELSPGRFLAVMVDRVLGATPVTMHREARRRRAAL
ncbi:hypothetical protein J7U46_06220 [Pelomonas sp. V22]|uniref:hypothetical protein n=1 Tax=Pelomonas sp. V22 TaxID=2822139 RepID=UPI0024A91CE9|nr:hypothetical protein [Pelomonas sp. V22]MDI4632635.1 hypothetical protein [Pelomonas sp. V22]